MRMRMHMTTGEARAVDQWIAGRLSAYLANVDQAIYAQLCHVATRAVVYDMGTGMDLDTYEMARRGRGQTDISEYADVVGQAVYDEIMSMIDESLPEEPIMANLIKRLVGPCDHGLRRELGEHWLPDVVDVALIFAERDGTDTDEDEDEEE